MAICFERFLKLIGEGGEGYDAFSSFAEGGTDRLFLVDDDTRLRVNGYPSLIAYLLGVNQDTKIALIMERAGPAAKCLDEVWALMGSRKYQKLFDVDIRRMVYQRDWITTRGSVSLHSMGITSPVTGCMFDIVILALRDKLDGRSDRALDWWRSCIFPRLLPGGKILISAPAVELSADDFPFVLLSLEGPSALGGPWDFLCNGTTPLFWHIDDPQPENQEASDSVDPVIRNLVEWLAPYEGDYGE